MGYGVREIPKNRKLARGLGRHRGHFVTQAEIQCEVGLPTPIVLHIKPEEGLTKVARRKRAGDSSLEPAGIIPVKSGQAAKLEDSIWIGECPYSEQHALDGSAEFDRMGAFVDKSVVVNLERIPMIEISRCSAHTTQKGSNSSNNYLRRSSASEGAQ